MGRGSVVGSWLLDLTADVLRHDNDLGKLMEEYQTVVKVVDLHCRIRYQPLLYLLPYLKDLIQGDSRIWEQNLKRNAVHVRRTQCSVNFSSGLQYRLYGPRYISGYGKGENDYYDTDKYDKWNSTLVNA